MKTVTLLPFLLLGLLCACGGQGGSPPPSRAGSAAVLPEAPEPAGTPRVLNYRNPASRGFRLEVDPATNRTGRLQLHLVPPEGEAVRGVALILQGDAQVLWSRFPGGADWFRIGPAWDPGAAEPRLARARVRGGRMEAGLFLPDRPPLRLPGRPVFTLALEVAPGALPGPAGIGKAGSHRCHALGADGILREMPLAVGALEVEVAPGGSGSYFMNPR